MLKVNLDELEARLRDPIPANLVSGMEQALKNWEGSKDAWKRVVAAKPSSLFVGSPYSANLDNDSKRRLKQPSEFYKPPDVSKLFHKLESEHSSKARTLAFAGLFGGNYGIRAADMRMSGEFGASMKTFPKADRVDSLLDFLDGARGCLDHISPIWSAILYRLIFLRIHPLEKANGRVGRMHLNFELWRNFKYQPTIITISRTIDANRNTHTTLVNQVRNEKTLYQYLYFISRILKTTIDLISP